MVYLVCGLVYDAGRTVTLVTASKSAKVVSRSLQLWPSWAPGFGKVHFPPPLTLLLSANEIRQEK